MLVVGLEPEQSEWQYDGCITENTIMELLANVCTVISFN